MMNGTVDSTKSSGNLDVKWIHGSPSPRHKTDPPIQVHKYNSYTFILRQSKDVSFEAPFMYLFFGNDRAILFDTGATEDPEKSPLRKTVDKIIEDWLSKNPRENYELIVAHTHSHKDHISGDSQFADRPLTNIIGKDLASVQAFFEIGKWPDDMGRCDLGGRVLEVVPSPGHDATAVAIYDPWTGILVTGDTVYPGRLYVFDFPAFLQSMNRLAKYVDEKNISHVLGCHIEMTATPKRDYPVTTKYQPDELPLQMTTVQLIAVRDAAVSVAKKLGAHAFDAFIIYHFPCNGALFKQFMRAVWVNFRHELGADRKKS